MKRSLRSALVIAAVALTGAAIAGAAVGVGGGSGRSASATTPALSTTLVTRTTLTQARSVSGTLDYGPPIPVDGRGSGVLTWLPVPGAVISRGRPAYEADNRPVPTFYGSLPLYRQLHVGTGGADVREVEQNLVALGYRGFTVDSHFTRQTARAVRKWQHHSGLPETGVVDRLAVVIVRGKVRVSSVPARLGASASGTILTYTGTTRRVRIDLDVALQGLVRRGIAATVTLPNATTVHGTVAAVGSVATPGATPDDPATLEVTVTIAGRSALGTLDQAPVSVELASATVAGVLTVPVAALVALRDGGYGVQLVTGATTRYLAVQLGMFAGGRVQISGTGLAPGLRVGIAS